jgi:hypothetical protein
MEDATTNYDIDNGAELLDDIVTFMRRFIVATDEQLTVAALWVLHTHAFNAAEMTPYLYITSPEKRSGKTRLLKLLQLLVAKPWLVVLTTPATLYRKIDDEHPALLLDEIDALFSTAGSNTKREDQRAIFNAGYEITGTVPRVVRSAAGKMEVVDFNVFSPKAFTGIGTPLPDTVADRSIPIRLQRKTKDEKVERLRVKLVRPQAVPLKARAELWTKLRVDELREMEPKLPDKLHDRAQEVWEPLLAIADMAGGDWPAKARDSAVTLQADMAEAESPSELLLRHLRDAFKKRRDVAKIATVDLLSDLIEREDAPWSERWRAAIEGEPADYRGPGFALGRLLKPYGIESHLLSP